MTVPDWELVKLSQAHVIVGVSRATLNRWYNAGILPVREIAAAPGKAFKLFVTAGDVRRAYTAMRAARHAPKRKREIP